MSRSKKLPLDHALRMTPEEYMKDRVEDQINWYSAKSSSNKKWFLRLEIAAILFSVSIPFVTDFITPSTTYMKTVVSFLGVSIAFITGLLSLMKYRDNWVEYRATAELLRRERFLYLTRSGVYSGAKPFVAFVRSVEEILATEVSNWKQNQVREDDQDEEEAAAESSASSAEATEPNPQSEPGLPTDASADAGAGQAAVEKNPPA